MGKALSFVARTLLMAVWIVVLFYVLNAVLMSFLLPLGVPFSGIGAFCAVLIGVFADRFYRRGSFVTGALVAGLVLVIPQPHLVTWLLLFLAFCAGYFLPRLWRTTANTGE